MNNRKTNSGKFLAGSFVTIFFLLCVHSQAFGQVGFAGPGPNNSNTELVPAPKTIYNRTLKEKDPGIYVKLKDWYCTSIPFREQLKGTIDRMVNELNANGESVTRRELNDLYDFSKNVKEEQERMNQASQPEYFNPLPGDFQRSIHRTCYTKAELDKIEKFTKDLENFFREEGYETMQPNDPNGTALLNYRRALHGVQ